MQSVQEIINTSNWRPFGHSSEVQVISRNSIPGITKMNLEGQETFLGEVRHLKSNSYLKENFPKDLSIAWTMMPAGKELPAHYHPCASLIIVTEGEGMSTGDSEEFISAGDIVFIPPWNLHGFKGLGENGFRALSIQFQETAIFSSEETPETTYFDRESIPLEQRKLKISRRNQLESISSVRVHGEEKNLGVVKNFAQVDFLKAHLPAYFSCAWVALNTGESLEAHVHTTDSMIIVTEGEGMLFGDREEELAKGDLVYVPAGQKHGFTGTGINGFWALSVQFEEESLYETSPKVRFTHRDSQQISYEDFVALNKRFGDEFSKNPIFKLPANVINNDARKRKMLFDCLQVMSNSFQRLMFARVSLGNNKAYQKVFLEHFMEELGHNTELEKERESGHTLWDPILEATTFWFYGKNFTLDDPGRIVMIQMCLEKGASIFYSHFASILKEGMSSEHIEKHCDADEGHDSLGVELLQRESEYKLADLTELMEQSWDMLGQFTKRMCQLIAEEQQ
jgi:quercetin dioxygenase-like cupin family protein